MTYRSPKFTGRASQPEFEKMLRQSVRRNQASDVMPFEEATGVRIGAEQTPTGGAMDAILRDSWQRRGVVGETELDERPEDWGTLSMDEKVAAVRAAGGAPEAPAQPATDGGMGSWLRARPRQAAVVALGGVPRRPRGVR